MGNYAAKVSCSESLEIALESNNTTTSSDELLEADLANSTFTISDLKDVNDVLVIGIIYGLVFLSGIVGNVLVVMVILRFQYMRTVTNTCLASLSSNDICLLIICIPLQYYKFISNVWMIGKLPCYLLHYVQGFTKICSVLTLTTISVERYLAIVYPIKALRINAIYKAKYAIATIWMISILAAAPHAAVVSYESVEHLGVPYYWCIRLGSNSTQTGIPLALFGVYQFLIILLIPTSVMVFCYGSVARALRKALSSATYDQSSSPASSERCSSPVLAKRALRKSSAASDDKAKQQIIQMLVAIVLLFLICWTPYVIDDLLVGFNVFCSYSFSHWLKTQRMTFAIMAYANSCANPFVYAFMSKNFHSHFKIVFSQFLRTPRSFRRRQTLTLTQTSKSSVNRASVKSKGQEALLSSLGKDPRSKRQFSTVSFQGCATAPFAADMIKSKTALVVSDPNEAKIHRSSAPSVSFQADIAYCGKFM